MKFDIKSIKKPYDFIESLCYRLEGAHKDVISSLSDDEYYNRNSIALETEKIVLENIINWIEKYSD